MVINYRYKERLTSSDLEQIVGFHRGEKVWKAGALATSGL